MSGAVLVIRENDVFSQILRNEGLSVVNLPLIKTEPLDDQSSLRAILNRIDDYDGVFFTSPVSAEVFTKEAESFNNKIRAKIYAMGTRANKVLEKAGISTVFDDSVNSAEELVRSRANGEFDNKKLLFVRGDRSMLTIPDLLKDRAEVDEVIVYRTAPCLPDPTTLASIRARIEAHDVEWACFFSPSAVEVFMDVFGNVKQLQIATIGKTTAGKARELGFDVRVTSQRSGAVNFAQFLLSHINDK